MKDNKVERVRQKVLMLKRQFLQGHHGFKTREETGWHYLITLSVFIIRSDCINRWVI